MESAVNAWRVARFVLYSPPLTLFVAYVRLFKDRSFFGSRGKRRSARSGLRLNAPTGLARSANGAPHETAPSRKRMTTRYSSCLRHRVQSLRARPHPTFSIFQVRSVHNTGFPSRISTRTHFPLSPQPDTVLCPICEKAVPSQKINIHIDSGCKRHLQPSSAGNSTTSSAPPSSATESKSKHKHKQKQEWNKLFGSGTVSGYPPRSKDKDRGKGKTRYVSLPARACAGPLTDWRIQSVPRQS